MRLLITGASGRLGNAVRSAVSASRRELDPVYWTSPRVSVAGSTGIDLGDPAEVSRAMRAAKPDAIIHLAGLTGGRCDEHPYLAERINVEATAGLARAAAEAGPVRFVFASTAALYGDERARAVSEEDTLDGTSTYARTKRDAEERLAALTRDLPTLSVVSLRIFNVYGRGFENSLVSRLLDSTAEHPVDLRGPNNFVRDYVRGADVADASISALDAQLPAAFVPVNIGTGVATTNEQLVDALSTSRPVFGRFSNGAPSYSCADIDRARALLGFNPSLLSGARR